MQFQSKILTITSLIIITLFLSFQPINAQSNSKQDSLLSVLNKTTIDTSKVRILIELGKDIQETDTTEAINYLQKAIQISDKNNFKLGEAKALFFLGTLYFDNENYLPAIDKLLQSKNLLSELNEISYYIDCLNNTARTYIKINNYSKAKEYFQQALKIANKNEENERQAESLSGIAIVYFHITDYINARLYYQKALIKCIENNNKIGISICLVGIGNVYLMLNDYNSSIEYYKKSLKVSKEINYQTGVLRCFINLGTNYYYINKIDFSLYYWEEALIIATKYNQEKDMAKIYSNLGIIYSDKKQIIKSLEFYNKALDINMQLNYKNGIITNYANIGFEYYDMGDCKKAIKLYFNALEIALEIKDKYSIKLLYENIFLCYEKMQNFKNAFEYHTLYKQVHDSIFNLETTKQISEIEIKYETEKIERENILLKTNLKLKTKKNENRKYIIVALFTGITIIIILLILIFILIKLRNNLHKKMLILYKKDSEISKLNINKKNNENKRILAERKIKEKENEILENKKIEIETISSFQKQKIGFHNRQLSSSTLLVISKNDRLQNTKKKIEQLILQKPKKIKKFGEIIIEIDNNIESENHWEDFKNHFNQVHPDFLIRLKSKHSNLTQKDLRFCAYLRINLGTNEISRLLNIQTNSVKKIKIRLKKKLTLSRIINLEKYVEKI